MCLSVNAADLQHFSLAEIKDLERDFIAQSSVSAEALMEVAGFQAAMCFVNLYSKRPALLFCGRGNNGGDGLVMARHLFAMGVDVSVVLMADRSSFEGLACVQLQRCEGIGVPFSLYNEAYIQNSSPDTVIVDACVGIGLQHALRTELSRRISFLNNLPFLRVSLDIPAGLTDFIDCRDAVIFKADATFTFGYLKDLFNSFIHVCGKIYFMPIGIPVYEHIYAQFTRVKYV